MCCSVMMSCSLNNRARRQHQRQHHGEPAEDGAGDEVGRENGGVPGRQNGSGEVEGDDAVHRQHQRSGEAG